MNLICLMDYILFQTFKTILNNQYSIELKDRKYAERFGFLSFQNDSDTATKTGRDAA